MKLPTLPECAESPVNFFRALGIYQSHSNSIIRNPRYHQHQILNQALSGEDLFISKPRQVGLTSTLMMYALWFAFFKPNKTVLFVNNKGVGPFKLENIKRSLDDSDPLLRFISSEITALRDGYISFRNGSKIISSKASLNAGRSCACDLIICDEFDFFRESHSILLSLLPALIKPIKNGQLIVGSTPNPSPQNSVFEDLILNNSKRKGHSIRILYNHDRYFRHSLNGIYPFSLQESGFFNGEEDAKDLIYENWFPVEEYLPADSDQVYFF